MPVDWIRPLKMIEDVASSFKNIDEAEKAVYLAVIRGDLRARLNGKILGPEWLKQIEKLENEEPFELPPDLELSVEDANRIWPPRVANL